MNTMQSRFSLFSLLIFALILSSCNDRTVRTYTANIPVYQTEEAWRQTTFEFSQPRELNRAGKIYIWNQYLFVNEFLEGVHIFDNSNPAAPVNLGFLKVHANVDIAINDQTMYLDSYNDLLAFDISDPRAPRLTGRVQNVFEFSAYGNLPSFDPNMPMSAVNDQKGIVIGWEQIETTEEVQFNNWRDWQYFTDPRSTINATLETTSSGSSFPGGSGQGGSLARFSIHDNHLYTLEDFELGVFSLAGTPTHLRDIALSRQSETLFPAEGRLFIGTTSGMLIYDLSNPGSPAFISDYEHVVSCDPVVVQNDVAFVTLSTGRNCRGTDNILQVIDLTDISDPKLMHEFQMTNPRGLGVDGETLFLCDGADGLKVFDKTDLSVIDQNQLAVFPGITSSDVIPFNNVLLMTAEEGIYQYDYSDVSNVFQLSLIPVSN